MKYFIKILFVILAMVPSLAFAHEGERISKFHSEIYIDSEGYITVEETIKVSSLGQDIQHGIYRDLPRVYLSGEERRVVSFEILKVTKDGLTEPFEVVNDDKGKRVYIGEENTIISPGEYTYTLQYRTKRQISILPNQDELYWNITGDEWVFPIDEASATIHLPSDAGKKVIEYKSFVNDSEQIIFDGESFINPDGSIGFKSPLSLEPYEGLTAYLSWPKGYISIPSFQENAINWILDRVMHLVSLGGLLIVLAYYFLAWHKWGRDPKKSIIKAEYEAPEDFSPAMIRSVTKMAVDHRGLSSLILSLAVKGLITIREDKSWLGGSSATVTKISESPKNPLSEEESVIFQKLFESSNEFTFSRGNYKQGVDIFNSFKDVLTKKSSIYYSLNGLTLTIGIFLSIGVVISIVWSLSFSGIGSGIGKILLLVVIPIFSILVANIVFTILLRKYTPEGRQLMDKIEGFKLFLTVTEKDRLEFHNPPQLTPVLFEKMLPYAIALNVEHKWGDQFTKVFSQIDPESQGGYPSWYSGSRSAGFNAAAFSASLGTSFANSVQSGASSPHSSSSGSSGGGGGGGGGGGW